MKLPDTPIARRLGHLITRWTTVPIKGGGRAHRYYSKCTVDGCGREISLQKYQSRQKGNLQCRTCSKIRGYVHGVPVRAKRIWDIRHKILEFRIKDSRLQPYIACAEKGCNESVLFRHDKYHSKDGPGSGRCAGHRIDVRKFAPYQSQYNALLRSAKRRNLTMRLTFKKFVQLYTATACHYCSQKMDKTPYGLAQTQALGIDRKDSALTYSDKNCVACCSACNFAKTAFITYEEMLLLGAVRAQNLDLAKKALSTINLRKNWAKAKKAYVRVQTGKKPPGSRSLAGKKIS